MSCRRALVERRSAAVHSSRHGHGARYVVNTADRCSKEGLCSHNNTPAGRASRLLCCPPASPRMTRAYTVVPTAARPGVESRAQLSKAAIRASVLLLVLPDLAELLTAPGRAGPQAA